MIRSAPWDVVASPVATTSGDAPAMRRFAAPERRLGFWLALWAVAIAAEFGALVPVIFPGEERVETVQVIYRLIGGSFAACGLIAWRRRPDSRSGLLMAVAGAGFFVSAIISQFDPPVAQTTAILLQELWAPFFVALLLTLLTGGRLESRVDWLLVGAFVLALWILQAVWLLFYEQDGNLLAAFPNADIADAVDKGQRSLAGLASVAVAVVVAFRWRAASPPRRRALLPSVAGSVAPAAVRRAADQRHRHGIAVADRPLVGHLLARDRPGGLPHRPAALAAGPRRPGRPLPRAQHDARRHPAGGAGQDARRPRARGGLSPAGVPRVRRRRRPPGAGAPGRRRPRHRARRERRQGDRDARLRRLARRRPRVGRRRARGCRHRPGERAPERRGAGPARGGAGLPRAHRRGGRRGAPAPGAQPARWRAAAPGRPVPAAAPAAGPHPRRRPARRRSSRQPRASSLPSRWRSCASWRAGSTPRCSTTVSPPRWSRWPRARPSRRPSPTTPRVACPSRSSSPPTSSPPRRWPTSPSTRRRPRSPCASGTTADSAVIEIADDGVGGADEAGGSGLRGLADRVAALDGRLRVVSPVGAGTTVTAELPCG